jgi:hypothetical protein
MEEKKTQFWLIGELTQHMDKKVLPSNGDILRRLFFIQKCGRQSFSEACVQVATEVMNIWQQ